jgi:hypothetical protein
MTQPDPGPYPPQPSLPTDPSSPTLGWPADQSAFGSPAPAPTPAPAAPIVAPRGAGALIAVLLIGAAVSVTLGVYGRLHSPSGVSINIAGFSGPQQVKVWLATLAGVLALVQLGSALVMYGKIPGVRAPKGIGTLHRWSGRTAFLAAVPVAVHCLYALGFQSYDTRVLLHSLAGCLFFGAFTVKMLSLSRSGLPGWLLPVFGSVVFTGLTVLWLTSAFWFFTTVGVQF